MRHKLLFSIVFVLLLSFQSAICAENRTPANPLTSGFSTGCNYWASHAGTNMWKDWNPGQVEKDLKLMAGCGITVLRVFPLWPDFQPLTAEYTVKGELRGYTQAGAPLKNYAGVDDEMVERFRFLCKAAEKNGISLVVGLVTGWMSGRMFVPQALEKVDVLIDADAIMWQTRYVKYLVDALKNEPAISAWDLGNECNCMGYGTRAQLRNWMYMITSAIRLADPTRPVVSGMHGVSSLSDPGFSPVRGNARDQGEIVDILTTHPYPLWTPGMNTEPFDGIRNACHAACETIYYSCLSGKPAFVEEAGSMGPQIISEDRAAATLRASLFSTWAAGIHSYCWWCAFDQYNLSHSPYDWTAIERELGLFSPEGKPKPEVATIDKFNKLLKTLPFKELPGRKVDAVVVISERENFWAQALGAWTLAREAGFEITYCGAEQTIPDSPFYILPSGTSYCTYSLKAYNSIMDKVREGATLLVTLGRGAVLSGTRPNFGIEVECHYKNQQTFTVDCGNNSFSISDTYRRDFTPKEAEVLLRDKNGNPVMTGMKIGKGQVLYFNAALEMDAQIDGWPVYELAAQKAGVSHIFKKSLPCVGVSEHRGADGRVWLVVVNYDNKAVNCSFEINGTVRKVYGEAKLKNGILSLEGLGACVIGVDCNGK